MLVSRTEDVKCETMFGMQWLEVVDGWLTTARNPRVDETEASSSPSGTALSIRLDGGGVIWVPLYGSECNIS